MIRRLEYRDGDLMLEWMHDKDTARAFRTPFETFDMEKVKRFIDNSDTDINKHFAVINDNDEYIGTVSLKNISMVNKSAEYAIVVRKEYRGTGAAKCATDEILSYAFDKLGLHKVYLNVLDRNDRAKSFYEKCGFIYEGTARDAIFLNGNYESLTWYGIINDKERCTNE
jgi:diamine N-acetyltransferase